MYHATTLPLTPLGRQPILAIQPALTHPEMPPLPTHDFLVLSPCPDFTPELNTAGATTFRDRAVQLCA